MNFKMTAYELWRDIAKGSTVAQLSEAQRRFLIDLAKKENIFDATNTAIRFPDGMIVRIRNCYTVSRAIRWRAWKGAD